MDADNKLKVVPYVPVSERQKKEPPYNNLFVKNFPKENFGDEDLKVTIYNLNQ